ncbi:MAG: CoA transferase, partial [Gammaproteobacteria bacterium]|nr:CoA transferase [Gammaproteobacteria bacterium]
WAQKQRTGEGQLIELSMQEAMTYYLRTAVSRTRYGEFPAQRTGNGMSPFTSLYPCKGNGANDYVFIMAVNPRMWAGVCKAIGKPDLLDDERFRDPDRRHANRDLLCAEIAAWTLTKTKREAMTAFAEAGVCASQVYETSDLFTDPHLVERDFIHELHHADHGDIRLLGWPARMSGSQVDIEAAPLLGEHTDEVLGQDLGLDETAIAALREVGAIGREMLDRDH